MEKRTNISLAIHTCTLIAFVAVSSAPTPLYRLYQAQWHFSSILLTLIFGIYAFALLLSLIIAGALSDHIGRRPVISAALIFEIGALGLFLIANSPVWLIAARTLQGLATGLATAALSAVLIDLNRKRAALISSIIPMAGMALGALGTTTLIQLAPNPLHLVFMVLICIFAVQLWLTWATPETTKKQPGALNSLRPNLCIPQNAKAELLATAPINVALWALGGFYLSLIPSLIAEITTSTSAWMGGLSVAALTLSGGIGILIVRRYKSTSALIMGAIFLIIGTPTILIAANFGWMQLLLLGSIIAGIGFGSGFKGALQSVVPLAKPNERAGLMAIFFMESYLANSLPVILAGYMMLYFDLLTVANVYGGAIILLTCIGLILVLTRQLQRSPKDLCASQAIQK